MIGIDISDRSIKIVRLSNGRRRRLLAYCWQEVPKGIIENGIIQNADGMRTILNTAFQKCSVQSVVVNETVIASIPESESFLRVIEIPAMDEQEVNESVQWEVAQHIPFGIENVYIDWQWVRQVDDASGARQEILVGATEKRVVDPLFAVLQSLDLDVAALELESQAIIRALISPALKAQAGLLVVDLGGSATNVVIHDRGTIRFTATLRKGSSRLLTVLSPAEQSLLSGPPPAKPVASVDSLKDKLRAGLDELVVEIRGIVEFYTGLNTEHRINEILLTGGGANLAGLDDTFLRHFDNVHIQRGNPWVNLSVAHTTEKAPLDTHESVHFATAIGLALRPLF